MFNSYSHVAAICPVCGNRIGFRIKGLVSSFLCEECGFYFTWDPTGFLLKPRQKTPPKQRGCSCASCLTRESNQ